MSSLSPLNWWISSHIFQSSRDYFFVIMSSSSHLNEKKFELGGFSIGYVQFATSEPTDSQVFLFGLLLCPVRHLWTVNTPNLVISNRLCPVYHLWTDEYPISSFFCHHVQIITSEWQNFELGGFSIDYVQFITSEPTDSQVFLFAYCYVQFVTSEQ